MAPKSRGWALGILVGGLGIPHDILLDSENNLFASVIKLKTSEECCYTERKFDDQK